MRNVYNTFDTISIKMLNVVYYIGARLKITTTTTTTTIKVYKGLGLFWLHFDVVGVKIIAGYVIFRITPVVFSILWLNS